MDPKNTNSELIPARYDEELEMELLSFAHDDQVDSISQALSYQVSGSLRWVDGK